MQVWQCRFPFCNKTVSSQGQLCKVHEGMLPDKVKPYANSTRKNEDKYNTYKWRETRRIVITRDGSICAICGASSSILSVHHIIEGELSEEDFYNPNNCVLLCKHCHDSVHAKRKR